MKKAMVIVFALVASMAAAQTTPDPSERAIYRRAVEAINWGMPAVNLDLMLQAGIAAGARPNQIVYWSRLPDWVLPVPGKFHPEQVGRSSADRKGLNWWRTGLPRGQALSARAPSAWWH